MKDRIIKLIEQEGLTPAEFADRIGVQRSSISHVINGRNNPGFSFIQKILENYKKVNPRWLLTGEGNIYESQTLLKPRTITEPSLFQNNNFNEDKSIDSSVKNSKNERIENDEIKTKDSINQFTSRSTIKKVTRVLLFFDDRSFEDFYPTEEK